MTSRTVSITSAADTGSILRLLRKETGLTQRGHSRAVQCQPAVPESGGAEGKSPRPKSARCWRCVAGTGSRWYSPTCKAEWWRGVSVGPMSPADI